VRQRNRHGLLTLPAALLLFAVPAAADTRVDEVEVIGNPSERSSTIADIDSARRELGRIAGGASIVDAESFRLGRVNTLQDVLGFTPGVLVQPRFGSEESRLSIRGSGLQRTFHLRGIKLLQDGVPLNLADGGGDFQAIDGLTARYVEVFRGANALQFGGTTLGGAVNFVSPMAGSIPPVQLRMEIGSFDYQRFQAAAAGASGQADGFIAFTHNAQTGYREQSEQGTQRIFGHAGWRFTDRLETRFFMNYTNTDSELPGNLTRAQLRSNPKQANAANVSGNQQRDFELLRLSNRTTWYIGEVSRIEFTSFYSYKDLYHPIFQLLEQTSDDFGGGIRLVDERDWGGRRNIFVAGVNVHTGYVDDDRFVNLAGQRGNRTAQREQTAVNYEFFAEEQRYVSERVALVLGAQYTLAKRDVDDLLIPGDPARNFSLNYRGFSPKLGARYEFSENAQVFTNVSRSFEPPSFGELTGGQTITLVTDQTATTVEVGSRGSSERWRTEWDVAYYYAWVDDELLSLNTPDGQPLGTVSADSTIHQGIEVGLVSQLGRAQLRQVYLWNDFRFDGDAAFGNNQLAGVPEHFYRADLRYDIGSGFHVGPGVEWVPRGYYVDHANTLKTDSYAIFGLRGDYRSDNGLTVFIEGRNLFDKKYAATTGVIANANGADSAQFLPGDGASIYVGLQWAR